MRKHFHGENLLSPKQCFHRNCKMETKGKHMPIKKIRDMLQLLRLIHSSLPRNVFELRLNIFLED